MINSQFKKYTELLIFTILTLLILVGGLNWFIDPYGIYNSPEIEGFNVYKPEFVSHLRMSKAHAIQYIKPKSICLGTSRAERGIDPSHEGWAYKPVYNLGIASANIYEIFRYFQHAHNVQPQKQVLLCLDFFSFKSNKRNAVDFNEERLSVGYDGQKQSSLINNDAITTLFSTDALSTSIETFRQQKNAGNVRYLKNGMLTISASYVESMGGQHAYFLYGEKVYAETLYVPEEYQFDKLNLNNYPFTDYRKLLQIAYQDSIDLRIIISPCHVRQWEIIDAAGLWPKLEEWKHILVIINEEEACHFGKPPFPLWDFSIYNELTTESLPPLGDMESTMHWWWDSDHYKKELGDLMLDRIFNYHGLGRIVPDDFGVLLNSENIDSNLQKIRVDRQQYRDTHPEDVAEIENLFK